MDGLYTVREMTEHGYREETLRKLIRYKLIPCIKIGNRYYLNPDQTRKAIETQAAANMKGYGDADD